MTAAGYAATVALDRVALAGRDAPAHRDGADRGRWRSSRSSACSGVAASSRGLTGEVSHLWHSLTNTNSVVTESPGRLASSPTAARATGARGSRSASTRCLRAPARAAFDTARTRYTSDTLVAGHAHSYVIETFADFGLIGALLSLALFVAWIIATGRTLGLRHPRDPPDAGHLAERAGLLTMLAIVIAFGDPLGDRLDVVLPGSHHSRACVRRLAGGARPAGRAGRARRAQAADDGACRRGHRRRDRRDRDRRGVGRVAAAALVECRRLGGQRAARRPDTTRRSPMPRPPSRPTRFRRPRCGSCRRSTSRSATWPPRERIWCAPPIASRPTRRPGSAWASSTCATTSPRLAVAELDKAVALDLTAVQPLWDLSDAYVALHDLPAARAALVERHRAPAA